MATLLKYIFVPLSLVVCGKWAFHIILHLKKNLYFVLEFVKEKKKARCDLVDNKITSLNSIMAFLFLVLERECFGWALGGFFC